MKNLNGVLPNRRISWEDFYSTLNKGFEFIVPDIVIGLREGATVMSAIIASQLRPVDYLTVCASAYKGAGSGNHGMEGLRGLAQRLHHVNKLGHMTRVLVVDDVCDSGETLKQAREILEAWGSHVSTVAYVTFDSADYVPDVTFYNEPSDQYIYFPWETQDVCDTDIK